MPCHGGCCGKNPQADDRDRSGRNLLELDPRQEKRCFLFALTSAVQYSEDSTFNQLHRIMNSRSQIASELDRLDLDLKALEIAYEQYFMGIEKREPLRERQRIQRQLQRLLTSHITQAALRFRLQSVSARFHSYAGHWDRILRLIDEGRYERHTSRMQRKQQSSGQARIETDPDPLEDLYAELVDAHQACRLKVPPKEAVAKLLARQQENIRQKFGDRSIHFHVVTENGKPKIKVRAKN